MVQCVFMGRRSLSWAQSIEKFDIKLSDERMDINRLRENGFRSVLEIY